MLLLGYFWQFLVSSNNLSRQTDSIWLRWWEVVGLVLWWEKSRKTMWLIFTYYKLGVKVILSLHCHLCLCLERVCSIHLIFAFLYVALS